MQSEQPRGFFWLLRSNPRLWATVIPVVTLLLAAFATSFFLLPYLPKDLRDAFESADSQANSKQLHVAERVAVKAELRRLATAAQERSIDYAECEEAIQRVRDVMFEASLTRGLVQKFTTQKSLPEEGKAAAEQALRRYAAAFIHGKVDEQTAEAIENLTVEVDDQGQRHFREQLPFDELQGLLHAMATAADEAGIPESVEPINVTARVKAIVDQALAKQ
ncbi:hypothetical protein [Aeoliella sp.]|uniref:hypothetical protein n=1 Tax=Aeoliella sp. TaxID=2795800 RepID=UPI003CCBC5F1